MDGARWFQLHKVPGFGLVLRLSLSLAAIGIAFLGGGFFDILPWALAVTSVDVMSVMVKYWRPEDARIWMPVATVFLTALGMTGLQVVGPEALLLLLVAAIHGGLYSGFMGTLIVGWISLIVGFLMTIIDVEHVYEGAAVLGWMGLAFLTALVAKHWHQPPLDPEAAAALEAKALLTRLASLADTLETGFDIPALGDSALEDIAEDLEIGRGAVLLRTDDHAVVVGLRGHTRMPWPSPNESWSILHRTWSEGVAMRGAFGVSPERSFILTVPITTTDDTLVGMIALDRSTQPFSAEDQRHVEAVAHKVTPMLEVGLLFSRLRGRAAIEERARLARDMHDGVAQELAALAFSVDTLIEQAPEDSPMRRGLESLRTMMRDSLGDIRSQISTLRMVERPGISLGAMLSRALQEFTSNTNVRTTMTLDESPFRFPAHVEMQVQRAALEVLNDARATGATFVDWNVWLAAPNARIVFQHDGATLVTADSYASHPLLAHGAVIVDSLVPQGLFLEIALGAEAPPPAHPVVDTLSTDESSDSWSTRLLSNGHDDDTPGGAGAEPLAGGSAYPSLALPLPRRSLQQ
ncbi:MAG: histidine kinase [Dermatophilaceae bacterium]